MDKDEIFGKKRMLSGEKGVQGKSLFINERLPKSDMEIKGNAMTWILLQRLITAEWKFFANDQMAHFIPKL